MTEYLYLIRCREEAFKIGIASDVRSRIASLQTGNPYKLELAACYSFPSAEVVERALHMKFDGVRMVGEWFNLDTEQLKQFAQICNMLDGKLVNIDNHITHDEIEEAEEIQESVNVSGDGAIWDYAAMFADGWRMNRSDSRGRYWMWRKWEGGARKSIYGGVLEDLPYPIEEMRGVYLDGLKPLLEGENHE
jgi:hypothetical protein